MAAGIALAASLAASVQGMAVPVLGIGAVALAACATVRPGELDLLRPRLDRADVGTLAAVWVVGLVVMGAWRVQVGLESDEALVVLDAHETWASAWTKDTGLPSYVHGLLVAPATWVGGVAWILGLHAMLYVALGALVLDLLRRVLPPVPARLAAATALLDPTLLHQVQELRAYATYLVAVAAGAAALLPRRRPEGPAWALAAVSFGVAMLDVPLAAVLVAAVAVAAALHATTDPGAGRGQRAALWVGAGAIAPVLTSLAVERGGPPTSSPPGPFGALLVVSALTLAGLGLALRAPRTRPLAIAALAGVGALFALWVAGHLAVRPKYALFLVPLALPPILHALSGGMGPDRRVAGLLALVPVLGALAAARTVALPANPDGLERLARLDALGLAAIAVVTVLAVAAAIARPAWRHAALLVPVGAFAAADTVRAHHVERTWLDASADTYGAFAAAKDSLEPGEVVCVPEPWLRTTWHAWSRHVERSGWTAPLRRTIVDGLPERIVTSCPTGPHLVLVGRDEEVPAGCAPVHVPAHRGPGAAQVLRCAGAGQP